MVIVIVIGCLNILSNSNSNRAPSNSLTTLLGTYMPLKTLRKIWLIASWILSIYIKYDIDTFQFCINERVGCADSKSDACILATLSNICIE